MSLEEMVEENVDIIAVLDGIDEISPQLIIKIIFLRNRDIAPPRVSTMFETSYWLLCS